MEGDLVLVVDADSDRRESMVNTLRRAGWWADGVDDVGRAAPYCESGRLGLAIIPVALDNGGLERDCDRLREMATPRSVALVGVSTMLHRSVRNRCLSAGMCDYVAMPVTAERLVRLVHRWHGRHLSMSVAVADRLPYQCASGEVASPWAVIVPRVFAVTRVTVAESSRLVEEGDLARAAESVGASLAGWPPACLPELRAGVESLLQAVRTADRSRARLCLDAISQSLRTACGPGA